MPTTIHGSTPGEVGHLPSRVCLRDHAERISRTCTDKLHSEIFINSETRRITTPSLDKLPPPLAPAIQDKQQAAVSATTTNPEGVTPTRRTDRCATRGTARVYHPEKSPNPPVPPPPFFAFAFPFAAAAVARAAASIAGSAQLMLLPLPAALAPAALAAPSGAVAADDVEAERGKVVAAAAPRYFPTP